MNPLLKFFVLAYLAAWPFFLAAGLPAVAHVQRLVVLVGTFAPGVAALWLTSRAAGAAGVRALVARLFEWRVAPRWYLFAFGYMASIRLAVAVVHRVSLGAWPEFWGEPWYVLIGATILSTVVGGQAGEELGWRGYALPRLAAQFGVGAASVVLGVLWAAWHLPLFFVLGADTYGQSFPLYLLGVTALSVAMAWLYVHTRGSLLMAMLMHAAINNTKEIVPVVLLAPGNAFAFRGAPLTWLTLGMLWVMAVVFLFRMNGKA